MFKRYDTTTPGPLSDKRSGIGNQNFIIGQDYSGKMARYKAGTSSGYGAQRVGLYASDLHKTPKTRPYHNDGYEMSHVPVDARNHQAIQRGRKLI